jgi:hypothetical protein
MRESCTYGSVRGASSNGGPYRNRRRSVQPLPDYTRRKPLTGGRWGYYFAPPTWALTRGEGDDRGPCPVGCEALGTDYAAAVSRVETVLLPLFDSWRTRGAIDLVPNRPRKDTLDWLLAEYRITSKFKNLGRKMRKLHDDGFALVADYVLKDGRRLGAVALSDIDPGVVDQLYQKLLPKLDAEGAPVPLLDVDGKPKRGADGAPLFLERRTTINHAMKSCRRAWNVAMRLHRSVVPAANPFARMGLVASAGTVTAATYGDLLAAVAQADAMNLHSLGTALMLTWEWAQREEHIFTAFMLPHYRPKDHPNKVYVAHPKNGEAVWIPLFDGQGDALFPDLMERMDIAKKDRVGTGPFFVRDWIDQKAGTPLPWATTNGDLRHMSRNVKAILKAAGLDPRITFTSFRHGGLTELGDSDLTDAQIRALSRHKSAKVLTRCIKRTDRQIIDGTHKRRAGRQALGGSTSKAGKQ